MLQKSAVAFAGTTVLLLSLANVSAQMSFKKVECKTAYAKAEEGKKGKLLVDARLIRFVKGNEKEEYFSLPSKAVKEIFYSRVSGRRIKTAIVVTPFLLFSKGKKHYMTLSFNDGKDLVGAVEFKLHKSNYRGILRAIEEVTGVELKFDQEGIKDEKESVAARDSTGVSEDLAVITISSEPENAEIEIDGAFAGSTPRIKKVKPGEYKIKMSKKGYRSWERKIKVEAGEEIPLNAELEAK